ncbi:head GIN domain-containing protein [Porphyromonas macacae]|uniref:head GIN domain-containing protein n=1 Tax=Porphyromonas macacae TaxID=28115 RepID=UPI0024AD19CB|nr:head GIN domain-containing protein [Porphyromonas macacae]
MNAKTIRFLCACFVLTFLTSCIYGNGKDRSRIKSIARYGEIRTEERSLSGFDTISISSAVDMILTQGDEFKVTVEANETLINKIKTELIDNNHLNIYMEKERRPGSITATVHVTLPTLTTLNIGGASDVEQTPGKEFICRKFTLKTQGAGDLNSLNVACDTLLMNVSGASDVNRMTARCGAASIHISGSSDINMDLDVAGHTDINVSGASDILLRGNTQSLTASLSGSSDADFRNFQSATGKINASGSSDALVFITDTIQYRISGQTTVVNYGKAFVRPESQKSSNADFLRK